MTKILAIDTATDRCSVALQCGAQLQAEALEMSRDHTEHVLRLCRQLLEAEGLHVADLDAIAFGRGPGSFTGVRIAASLAQGLALPWDTPLVPVSDLDALAEAQTDTAASHILVAMDARMGEVYSAAYQRQEDGWRRLGDESVLPPEAVLWPELPDTAVVMACGTGWAVAGERLQRGLAQPPSSLEPEARPHAREIARLAERAWRAGQWVGVEHALPVYLRDKVAETVAERAAKQR